jgi:hypothetical protein
MVGSGATAKVAAAVVTACDPGPPLPSPTRSLLSLSLLHPLPSLLPLSELPTPAAILAGASPTSPESKPPLRPPSRYSCHPFRSALLFRTLLCSILVHLPPSLSPLLCSSLLSPLRQRLPLPYAPARYVRDRHRRHAPCFSSALPSPPSAHTPSFFTPKRHWAPLPPLSPVLCSSPILLSISSYLPLPPSLFPSPALPLCSRFMDRGQRQWAMAHD